MKENYIKKRKVENGYISSHHIIYLVPLYLILNLCVLTKKFFLILFDFILYNSLSHSINEYKYSINLLSKKQRGNFKKGER